MKVLGLITARGGSKGIPGKNIKLLGGKPLIAYTIEAAKNAGVFDRLILSTDDEKIASIAREYGCDVPFLRPAEFANDTAAHLPVVQHAVAWLKEHEMYEPDAVMILQPTSPLRKAFHIREAVELLAQNPSADSVLSVAPIPEHFSPHKAMVIDGHGWLELLNGNPIRKRIPRKQDLPRAYRSVGSVYLFKTHLILHPTEPNFYGTNVLPYEIDPRYAVDIDTPEDWELAEKALKKITK